MEDAAIIPVTSPQIARSDEDDGGACRQDGPRQESFGSSPEGMTTMIDNSGRWAVGVFGDSTESGSWHAGTNTRAVAVFGDSTLDMRQSVAGGEAITVRAVAGFGDVRVLVPAGSRVEISGLALFGSKRSEVVGDPTAGGPVVRIKAWALFGDVKVA